MKPWVSESGSVCSKYCQPHLVLTHSNAQASQMASVVKNPPASVGDVGSIPGSGRSPGEGSGTPLQYSCLENPMERGAWWATVHGVAKSQR